MVRKNIFEQLSDCFDFQTELERIDMLLSDKSGIRIQNPEISFQKDVSVIQFIDDNVFKTWRNRNRCISCKDMGETLGLQDYVDGVEEEPDEYTFLSYLEFASDIMTVEIHTIRRHCYETVF